jgi:hypothetical protein
MNTPIDAIRLSADYAQLGPCLVGFNPYACWIVEINNDQSFNATTAPVIFQTRLTVANAYSSYAPGDGYLNPPVRQMSGQQILLSGGAITDNLITMGPFVFPYETTFVSGGTDPVSFQPDSSTFNNQLYVWINTSGTGQGLALNANNGNYFEVKKLQLSNMNNISYLVVLQSTSYVPST